MSEEAKRPTKVEVGQRWRDRLGEWACGKEVTVVAPKHERGGWRMSHGDWWSSEAFTRERCEYLGTSTPVTPQPAREEWPEPAEGQEWKCVGSWHFNGQRPFRLGPFQPRAGGGSFWSVEGDAGAGWYPETFKDKDCLAYVGPGTWKPSQGSAVRDEAGSGQPRLGSNSAPAAAARKPALPPRRQVSHNGRDWVDYASLTDADPFESYRWCREINALGCIVAWLNESPPKNTTTMPVGRYLSSKPKGEWEGRPQPLTSSPAFPDISPKAGPAALADWRVRVQLAGSPRAGTAGKGR